MGKDYRACDSMLRATRGSGSRYCVATGGDVKRAAGCRTWKFTTKNFGAFWGMTPKRT